MILVKMINKRKKKKDTENEYEYYRTISTEINILIKKNK